MALEKWKGVWEETRVGVVESEQDPPPGNPLAGQPPQELLPGGPPDTKLRESRQMGVELLDRYHIPRDRHVVNAVDRMQRQHDQLVRRRSLRVPSPIVEVAQTRERHLSQPSGVLRASPSRDGPARSLECRTWHQAPHEAEQLAARGFSVVTGQQVPCYFGVLADQCSVTPAGLAPLSQVLLRLDHVQLGGHCIRRISHVSAVLQKPIQEVGVLRAELTSPVELLVESAGGQEQLSAHRALPRDEIAECERTRAAQQSLMPQSSPP